MLPPLADSVTEYAGIRAGILKKTVIAVKLRTLHPKPLPAMGGSGAVPLAVYKYSRLAYQQAGKHDMSGKLHTSCILCIAKRAPSRMPFT